MEPSGGESSGAGEIVLGGGLATTARDLFEVERARVGDREGDTSGLDFESEVDPDSIERLDRDLMDLQRGGDVCGHRHIRGGVGGFRLEG